MVLERREKREREREEEEEKGQLYSHSQHLADVVYVTNVNIDREREMSVL